ncbi:MAG: chromosomal replication initiator protein DnaA [Pseudomonadota bacterium]
MTSIWDEVKSSIRKHIPVHSYRMWIEPMEYLKSREGSMILSCPNLFSKKRVQDHYGALIESEIKRISGESGRFFIEISGENGASKQKPPHVLQLPLPSMNVHRSNGCFLRKDFTFDQFVVGGNNDFAYSAALSLASRKNGRQSSLLLLSKTGMGKSHLSQAVGNFILTEHSTDRVYYITAEDFSNEMVQSFRTDSIDKFKTKYRRGCDVLLLEDIHYLSGKTRTQVELALTLDSLFEAGKKIIFSSCYLPADIPKLNDKLSSRLSCGIISNIDPPNFRTRVRILQKKAQLNNYTMPNDIIEYLAGELTEDIRQLESGLIGVNAKSSLLGVPIDLGLAESVVKNIIRHRKAITIDVIKKLVCKHYNISISDIVSSSRKQFCVRPRQIAMYLSRRYTDSPLQMIGKSFNRYHATALHAIGVVEKGLRENGPIQKQVEFFSRKLESGKF